ncbi:MAG: hypothetical protein U9P36_02695 [Thermodesulfobacteriota bacterium]|nr:hypothetical protein [Thermodesulfobacteriota bacterium]
MCKTRKYIVTLLSLFIVLLLTLPVSAGTGSGDASWRKTVEAFIQIPCMSCEEVDYGKNVIRGLDYNSQRIFRKMSLLPGANFGLSQRAWDALFRLHLSYEQMLTFEDWADLNETTMELAIQALPEIKSLNYEAGKAFRAYLGLEGIKPNFALKTIPLLTRLEDANNRALQGFFSVGEMTVTEGMVGLAILSRLTTKQAWACEAFSRVKDMNRETILDGLPLIRQLRDDDAWNARTLYKQETMSREAAWNWLVSYFATPPPVQEAQFYRLNAEGRTNLLRAFYDGGEELIWKINNLHGVTDRFGMEISDAQLHSMSKQDLYSRFQLLSQQTLYVYGKRFYPAYRAGRREVMINLLRKATSADRRQVAMDLTSANIYALLAQGSELYDSSFRDILVPILKKRIKENHQDNLLHFIKAIDSGNLLVSNFIVSLAQKGKLTTFFPEDARQQEQILELVAASAFKDEDTILLFSATFKHLLTVLESESRSFLIYKMVMEADRGTCTFSTLITVILQYYLQEYPELLGTRDRVLITRAIIRYGAVDLSRYLVTPFAEWKTDGRLGSISVFHPDDDGRKSFISNGRTLLKNGYRITLSEQYTLAFLSPAMRRQISALISNARKNPDRNLPVLFSAMQHEQFSVAFVKKIRKITIRHSLYVYAGEKEQQQLLKRFLLGGDEMFAQRGHSYWRSEQITEPLEKLKQEKQISDQNLTNKQRFMSLGSCGGVKAYTRLTKMFLGHIDILATIGTGLAIINDPYNRYFFEIVAKNPSSITWKDMTDKSSFIFAGGRGADYLQPGSLTAILHKILDEERKKNQNTSTGTACPKDQ